MGVGQAVIETLVSDDIDTVFGIPGKQSLPLNEAIGARDDIRFVVARHETAVTHQAWGYAETSGRMAATVVIPGPGDMNAMNGLKNALNDCTPILHIAIETDPELRGGDGIHETPPDTYDNVVKHNHVVQNPQATIASLKQAITLARTPPKGPVRVGIPKSFLSMDVPLAEARYSRVQNPTAIPSEAISAAAELLADARDPIILAGGGVRAAEASDELIALAERLQTPVVTTYKGKGTIPDDHDLAIGCLSGSASPELLEELERSEILLGIGSDFDAVATRGFTVDLPEKLVHITLNPDDIGEAYDPTVGIVADAAESVSALVNELEGQTVRSSSGASRARGVRSATEQRIRPLRDRRPPTSVDVLQTVRDALPRETIVAADAGGFRVWALNTFDAYGPRRYVNPGSWATMGTGVPSAIGAKLANPDKPVVALTGDGGLLMCVHELHTAAAEEIPIIIIVLNNNDYAIISEEAGRSYDLHEGEYGWGKQCVDFSTVAAGMGLTSIRVDTSDELQSEIDSALTSQMPTLIEIPTDPNEPQASEWMSD